MSADFGSSSEFNENDKIERTLLAPYEYICQMPGKMIRHKLVEAFNVWLGIPEQKLAVISDIVCMLHHASLMIDDIEDSSILRRGLPVAHSIYGTPRTINAANYVYFLGLNKCLQLGHPNATSIFCGPSSALVAVSTSLLIPEQMLKLHRGQGQELYWRDSVTCPTREQYETMVIQKTGGLIGLAIRLMQLFSPNQSDFTPLSDTLGLLFQIRDDYANLHSAEYADKKTYAEDLTEGKFSFPIIHAIESESSDGQVLNILRQKPTEFKVKRYCIDLLERIGSFAFTRRMLHILDSNISAEVQRFGGNEHMDAVMGQLREIYHVTL